MKEMWEAPRILVEEFAANEYVAVCWDVACQTGIKGGNSGTKDEYEYQYNKDGNGGNNNHAMTNAGTGCGHEDNQYIYEAGMNASGDTLYGMKEVNVDGQDDLVCTIWTDENTKYQAGYGSQLVSGLTDGMKIFWTTANSFYTWFHWGYVDFDDPSHPNRS